MVRLLLGNSITSKKHKKRLSPSARSVEGRREQHPMYQYALNEFSQTVAAGTSNDDGMTMHNDDNNNNNSSSHPHTAAMTLTQIPPAPSTLSGTRATTMMTNGIPNIMTAASSSSSSSLETHEQEQIRRALQQQQTTHSGEDVAQSQLQQAPSSSSSGVVGSDYAFAAAATTATTTHTAPTMAAAYDVASMSSSNQPTLFMSKSSESRLRFSAASSNPNNHHPHHHHHHHDNIMDTSNTTTAFEKILQDAGYEEYYGEAYTGAPMRYIYPSGYQSMRPRSCPWKLSIVVCICFTWLSVFIVGHCSDAMEEEFDDAYFNNNNNNNYNNNNANQQQNQQEVDVRWCGSRPLYLLWVACMLITGISAAYCAVIGYVKVRDFAVANSRSQPPGVFSSMSTEFGQQQLGGPRSDYYIRIVEEAVKNSTAARTTTKVTTTGSDFSAPSEQQQQIYQSDGTPLFWGAHIYRPTQAAVAITSR